MNKIKDYRILEGSSPIGLQKQVMKKIADGYELVGGLVSIPASYGNNHLNEKNNIAQAVVLYDEQVEDTE